MRFCPLEKPLMPRSRLFKIFFATSSPPGIEFSRNDPQLLRAARLSASSAKKDVFPSQRPESSASLARAV